VLAHHIEHYGRVVREKAAPIVSGRDSLQNLRITEAIVEAARSGSIVDTTPV
jgi:predicted dehydrogenase